MTQSHEEALKNYHRLYNNDAFQRVEVAVVADICGPLQVSSRRALELALNNSSISDLMNLVTDCAQFLCGYPHENPFAVLREKLVEMKAAPELVQSVAAYLDRYERYDQHHVAPFRETTLAVLLLDKIDFEPILSYYAQQHDPISALDTTFDLAYNARSLIEVARRLLLEQS